MAQHLRSTYYKKPFATEQMAVLAGGCGKEIAVMGIILEEWFWKSGFGMRREILNLMMR